MGLNFGELMVVLVTIFVIAGVGRLPQVAEAVGRMRRSYQRGLKGEGDIDITPPAPPSPRAQEPEDAQIVEK
jgi:Sec-independent protein translocase protein TatA